MRGGLVHGSSDSIAALPRDGRVLPQDLHATIFHLLGIEPDREFHDAVGRPIELYRSPLNRFVAGFIGTPSMNFIEGSVRREDGVAAFVAEGVRVGLSLGRQTATSEPRTMGIRPEDLRIVPGTGAGTEAPGMTGKVVLVERLGGTSHIHFDVGKHRLLALVGGDPLPDVGDVIAVHVPPARVHLFNADGGAA